VRPLHVGIVFPHTEVSGDPAAVRDFAVTAEALGFSHVMAFDHVLGVNPTVTGYANRYNSRTPFTDPFVLFAFMASITTRLGFITSVLVLPQRQTALVAKQAADVALLSGGRLRLGVGTGWNEYEYEALGVPFAERGERQEEQVRLLKRLWQEETLSFEGRWHKLTDVGIVPRPSTTIPIWFGATRPRPAPRLPPGRSAGCRSAGPASRARRANAMSPSSPRSNACAACSRPKAETPPLFGIEGFVNLEPEAPDRWARQVEAWATAGATHVALRTQPIVLPEPRPEHGIAYHLGAMRRFAEAVIRPA